MSNPVLEGWQRKQFKHLCEIVNGQVDPNEQPYCDMKHIGPGNVEKFTGRLSEVRTALEDGQISGKYLFTEEDVLYGKINPHFAKVAFPKYSGVCSADMYPVKCLSEISPGFLFQCLLSDSFTRYAESVSGRTGMPKINREDLDLAKFLLPPLPEQQKIASILTSVDDVIEKTEAQISKLQDLKQGMMQELLTKGIGHTEFKDSPVGRIPKSWDVKQVDEIKGNIPYSLVGGPFGSDLTSKDYVADPGVPVIRGVNLSDAWEKFHDADFVFVSEDKASQLNRNSARPGDFVFTQRGTLGQVGIIPQNAKHDSYIISQSQMKLTPNVDILNLEYLYQYFRSPVFLKLIDLSTIATGLPHINLGILKALPVPIPGRDEQCRIAKTLLSVDKKISGKLMVLESVRLLKRSLMQDLLTGKVRVKVS